MGFRIHPVATNSTGETMQKATIRIKEVRRPISDETIGYRLQAAHPNQAARKMKTVKKKGEVVGFAPTANMTTSFTRQYLAYESSDATDLSERDFERFKDNLKSLGFTHYQWVDGLEIVPLTQ